MTLLEVFGFVSGAASVWPGALGPGKPREFKGEDPGKVRSPARPGAD